MGTKKLMRAIEEGLDTNLESEILHFMHRLPHLNLEYTNYLSLNPINSS